MMSDVFERIWIWDYLIDTSYKPCDNKTFNVASQGQQDATWSEPQ